MENFQSKTFAGLQRSSTVADYGGGLLPGDRNEPMQQPPGGHKVPSLTRFLGHKVSGDKALSETVQVEAIWRRFHHQQIVRCFLDQFEEGYFVLKAGIFLDIENLSRNGGWGLRYDVIKKLVEAQDCIVVRANAYLAVDFQREDDDPIFQQRGEEYRNALRRNGFHLTPKEVIRYRDSEGNMVVKANADLDLAVDAILQAENLDYILLGSGDGDFVRVVRALQHRGKRVDVISFANTSYRLRQEADYYFSGFLVPGLLPSRGNGKRRLGFMYAVNEEKGYGFLSVREGLEADDETTGIFLHINDFTIHGQRADNESFSQLKTREAILEFDLIEQPDGRLKAANAVPFEPMRQI